MAVTERDLLECARCGEQDEDLCVDDWCSDPDCNGRMVSVGYVRADHLRGALGALEAIRMLGAVCDQYETCEHRACRDSYTAWALADQYLGGDKR